MKKQNCKDKNMLDNKEEFTQISIKLSNIQIKYLKIISKNNFMSRTAYIRKLIQADLEKNIKLIDKCQVSSKNAPLASNKNAPLLNIKINS